MKLNSFIVLSVLVSSLAFADSGSSKQFVGNYRAVGGDCVKDAGSYPAAISYDAKKDQLVFLDHSDAGDDAIEDAISLSSGTTGPLTSDDPNSWETSVVAVRGSVMEADEKYYRQGQQIYSRVSTLEIVTDSAGVQYLIRTGDRGTCKYQRQ